MPVVKLEFDTVKKKIEKAQNRRYITSNTVLSLETLFHVPKVVIVYMIVMKNKSS